jgi:Asp-tRNA(Asn)/Glu-tRNA(Gln) amidotransferase A subunit family amidase
LQFIGPPFGEELILRAGDAYENSARIERRLPEI